VLLVRPDSFIARTSEFNSSGERSTEREPRAEGPGTTSVQRQSFGQAPCADVIPANAKSVVAAAQFYVARFNDELAGGPANPGIAPIGAEELQTALDTAHAANYEYHASTEEQDQLNDLRNLRFGNEVARTVAERHAFEWSERLK